MEGTRGTYIKLEKGIKRVRRLTKLTEEKKKIYIGWTRCFLHALPTGCMLQPSICWPIYILGPWPSVLCNLQARSEERACTWSGGFAGYCLPLFFLKKKLEYILFSVDVFWIKRDSKLELYFGFGCWWEVGIANLFHLPSVYSISLPIIIIFSWVSIAKINRRMNKCTTRTATNSTKPIILRVATNVTRLVDIYSCCN